jgi:tetratricopeptide (TPR) repeat protein
MSLILTMLAPMLAQVGPFTNAPAAPPLRPPEGGRHGAARAAAPAPPAPAPRSRLQSCLDSITNTPVDAIDDAEAWRDSAEGSARAEPGLCLGSAHARLEHWDEAEAAFLAGRDAAAEFDQALRAKLGAMAGNAALAQGAFERALPPLDMALADAKASSDLQLTGEVQIDRARALVALKREAEAGEALVEARTSAAANPLAWLLSATLSRRQGKLAQAQAQIATAAELAPHDAEVGLEAGVIAMLAGNEAAARKSWQSAIAAAPASEAAATAKGYLAQLGEAPQSKP